MIGVSKYIVAPQKVVPTNLGNPGELLEGRNISAEQEEFNPYLATGAYGLL